MGASSHSVYMILLESQGEVDRHREILRPFKPARQAELPAPLITLNISPRSQASFTVSEIEVAAVETQGGCRNVVGAVRREEDAICEEN